MSDRLQDKPKKYGPKIFANQIGSPLLAGEREGIWTDRGFTTPGPLPILRQRLLEREFPDLIGYDHKARTVWQAFFDLDVVRGTFDTLKLTGPP